MIIYTDLPASVSPCAAAGITEANVSADANTSAVSFGRLRRMRSLASGLSEHDLFRKSVILFGIMRYKLSDERTAITHAFGRKLPSGLRTPPPGRMIYCSSGCSIHHGASCA